MVIFKKVKNSIKIRLVIFFLISTIFPTLLIGVVSYSISVKVIEEKASKASVKILMHIKGNIEKQIENIEEVFDVIFVEESIKKAIGQNYSSKEKFNYNALSAVSFFDSFFLYSNVLSYISSIAIVGDNGYNILLGENGNFISADMLRKIDLYDRARLANGKIVWENTHESFAKIPTKQLYTISLARLIKDENFDDGIGVVFLSFKESVISDLYDSIELSEGSSIFIVDNMGRAISHSDEKYLAKDLSNLNYINKTLDKDSGYLVSDVNGIKMLVTYYISSKMGWKIVETVPISELVKESDIIKRITLLCILISLAIGGLFSVAISELISRPIRNLRNTMLMIEKGNIDVKADESRKDEIGQLSHSFNYMIERIKDLFDKILKEQVAIKEIEYQNLLSQINPHFLYNTLNSIRWMAIIQNADSIKDMVTALGGLLQKSIKYGDKLITISEELDMVYDYISIQTYRYTDKFEVEYNIDEDVLALYTSKFILQPLIENAIFHGIEPKDGKGIIKVEIKKVDDRIVFKVYDNGIGIGKEKIKKIFEKDFSNKRGFNSIGIKNIDSRIKMIYGKEYGIKIESKENIFTEVRISIPILNQKAKLNVEGLC